MLQIEVVNRLISDTVKKAIDKHLEKYVELRRLAATSSSTDRVPTLA